MSNSFECLDVQYRGGSFCGLMLRLAGSLLHQAIKCGISAIQPEQQVQLIKSLGFELGTVVEVLVLGNKPIKRFIYIL